MKRRITPYLLQFVIFLGTASLFTSCKIAYIPSLHNVPGLQKKNDFEVHITPSNLQGAYAITNNFEAMINGQISGLGQGSSSNSSGSSTYKRERAFLEGGLGYYKLFESDKLFQVLGGASYGEFNFINSYTYFERKYKTNATKFFIQPSVSMINKNYEFAFAVKGLSMHFFNIDTNNYSLEDLKNDKLYDLDKKPFLFVEPSITAKVGNKNVKFLMQFVWSLKMNQEALSYYDKYLFLGICFQF